MPTVDGDEWVRNRIAFLEGLLAGDPTSEQRTAIEAELGELRATRSRWPRWLRLPKLPHQH
ncbi:MAG TPA: hypothetical protein VGZ52_10000 [Acidimicrobiales bacterium]|nr:hypothetical protein [Acidimicrobiales bacterium]